MMQAKKDNKQSTPPLSQTRRIYARFCLGMTMKEIAQIEGVDRRRMRASIRRALKKPAYLLDANK